MPCRWEIESCKCHKNDKSEWKLYKAIPISWRERKVESCIQAGISRARNRKFRVPSARSRDVHDWPRPVFTCLLWVVRVLLGIDSFTFSRSSHSSLFSLSMGFDLMCSEHTTGWLSACQWHGVSALSSSGFIPLVKSLKRRLIWWCSTATVCRIGVSVVDNRRINRKKKMGPSWVESFFYSFESDWWPSGGLPCPPKPLPFCRLHWMLVS